MTALVPGLAAFGGLILAYNFFSSLKPLPLAPRLTPEVSTTPLAQQVRSWLRSDLTGLFYSKKRLSKILSELPDFLELLAVSLASGESIYSSLARVVPRLSGELAKELKITLRAIEYGDSLEVQLDELVNRTPQPQLAEVCHKLVIALNRGTPLAAIVAEQAEAVREELANQQLKQAGKNETRMLVPLVFLILPVTVLFAVYPSLQLLNMSFI